MIDELINQFGMKKYPNGDMVHPTKEGYELFYFPVIEKAIENAIMQRSN